MKKLLLFFFFLIFAVVPRAQSEIDYFIEHVNSLTDSISKISAVDSFMNYAKAKGIPFIENNIANFIYLGNDSSVNIAGDFTNWNHDISMKKLKGTDFFYYSRKFEPNARLDYKLIINNKNWILDPNNSGKVSGGYGQNSELAMPNYIQPWEINYNQKIKHGKIVLKKLKSAIMDTTFQLKIYLPPGYDSSSSKNYPSVYFQDGFDYINLAKALNVIDNLIDSNKIKPLIAVFVQPNNRNEEYGFSNRNKYVSFFVKELVPFIDKNFRTISKASERMVMGCSLGGNISALISYNYPNVFGNCGMHSGALWVNNNEAYNLIAAGPEKNIKFALVWGTYESLDENLRSFSDVLIQKGYQVDYHSFPEGHSWGLWRANIDRFLIYFFPFAK